MPGLYHFEASGRGGRREEEVLVLLLLERFMV